MPENVEKIKVSYSYFRPTKGLLSDLKPTNTVDIGLNDCDGNFLGWSGSAHSEIFVGEYSSTPGYLTLPIKSGKWQIIIGAYKIVPEGVDVEYVIDFDFKGEKLLFGDLHIHSTASDGKLTAYEIAALAKKKGLDFIALANHNNYAENYHLPFVDDLTFIPATEWTHYKGHMNFFGVKAPFDNSFVANTKEEMLSLIDSVRKKGAIVSVNHPKCNFCPYLWEDENAFDMMEIWNGPMRGTNTRGIKWWTELLKKGRQIPAVGGSDFHKLRHFARLGNPVTGVYAPSRSAEDILTAISQGNCFVADKKDGVRINLKYADTKMGGTAKLTHEDKLIVQTNAKQITLVTQRGEENIPVTNGRIEKTIENTNFVYAIAYIGTGKLKKIVAVSNPIYFKEEK